MPECAYHAKLDQPGEGSKPLIEHALQLAKVVKAGLAKGKTIIGQHIDGDIVMHPASPGQKIEDGP